MQYFLKPRATGAILPSSRFLARKMMANIDFGSAQSIVEFGPGTGVFTREILRLRKKDTKILLIERNEDFFKLLIKDFSGEENVFVFCDSAENVGTHLAACGLAYADYIVSGLPFASLPHEISQNILARTRELLKPDGRFITFQYTLLKMKIFAQHFNLVDKKREFRNVPPAYALTFRK
ncbi:MAG: SAM-dependent methyltransferase [Defluviitaleaceae bacterium]|nr:SAM-dependent methyltransferase [Defluviitaleaceae bacterium]